MTHYQNDVSRCLETGVREHAACGCSREAGRLCMSSQVRGVCAPHCMTVLAVCTTMKPQHRRRAPLGRDACNHDNLETVQQPSAEEEVNKMWHIHMTACCVVTRDTGGPDEFTQAASSRLSQQARCPRCHVLVQSGAPAVSTSGSSQTLGEGQVLQLLAERLLGAPACLGCSPGSNPKSASY